MCEQNVTDVQPAASRRFAAFAAVFSRRPAASAASSAARSGGAVPEPSPPTESADAARRSDAISSSASRCARATSASSPELCGVENPWDGMHLERDDVCKGIQHSWGKRNHGRIVAMSVANRKQDANTDVASFVPHQVDGGSGLSTLLDDFQAGACLTFCK